MAGRMMDHPSAGAWDALLLMVPGLGERLERHEWLDGVLEQAFDMGREAGRIEAQDVAADEDHAVELRQERGRL